MLILTTFLTISAGAQAAQPNISIVTENWPPYNYEENGNLHGVSYEVVSAVLEELNISPKIDVYPWARAYSIALRDENTLIFSISRKAERETLFKWVGSILKTQNYLFALSERSDIATNSLEDLKQYKVGAVREDIRDQYLSKQGFDTEPVSKHYLNIKKLMNNRIDLMAM